MGNSALGVTKKIWRRKKCCPLGKSGLNIFQGKKLGMNRSKEEFTEKENLEMYHSSYLQCAHLKYTFQDLWWLVLVVNFLEFTMTIGANLWAFMCGIIYIRLIQVGKHILNVACFTLFHGLDWIKARKLALSDSWLKYVMRQTALRFYCHGFQAMVDCHTML